MNAKFIAAGLIAGSCITYLALHPEPQLTAESESESVSSEYLFWNYQNRVWEIPDCDTDSDCEEKYGSDSEGTILIHGSRRF